VLLRVAYFADLDTLLNLLRIEEFRKSAGSFFDIVIKNGKRSSYFKQFKDLRHLELEAMAERSTNKNDINLIEISNSSSYDAHDLARVLPKGSRNIIVILRPFHTYLEYIYSVHNSIAVVVVGKSIKNYWFTIDSPHVSYFYHWNDRTESFDQEGAQRKCDSYQMNFRKIELNGIRNLFLKRMKRILELESQNLFAPMLEKLSIYRCHEGILRIFSKEVLENQLTYLEIESSSVDPSREGQLSNITNFKNLLHVKFCNIRYMKNVRFEKLESVTISLGPSIDGELRVLENVEFLELTHLILEENKDDGYHHEIKNFQAPKLKMFGLKRCDYTENREGFKQFSLSSSLNFCDTYTWDIGSMTCGIFRFRETVFYIRNLSIQRCDGQVGELGTDLLWLRELTIYVDHHFNEFPQFTKVPNLKRLIVTLGTSPVDGFVSHIGKYYSQVEYLKLHKSDSKAINYPYEFAGCATFQNLKILHIDRFFNRCGIDKVKLPWKFPNLQELKYYFEAEGNFPAALTMDFDLPKLTSLTYILLRAKTFVTYMLQRAKFSFQDFPRCFEIRNCPVLESVEIKACQQLLYMTHLDLSIIVQS
jgi:hypothetical protein